MRRRKFHSLNTRRENLHQIRRVAVPLWIITIFVLIGIYIKYKKLVANTQSSEVLILYSKFYGFAVKISHRCLCCFKHNVTNFKKLSSVFVYLIWKNRWKLMQKYCSSFEQFHFACLKAKPQVSLWGGSTNSTKCQNDGNGNNNYLLFELAPDWSWLSVFLEYLQFGMLLKIIPESLASSWLLSIR